MTSTWVRPVTSPAALETLLAPGTVDDFAAAVRERRALYRAGEPDRYTGVFSLDDFEELVLTLTSPTERHWLEILRDGGGIAVDGRMLDRHGMLVAAEVFERFARGYSLILNQVHRRSMWVRRVCRDLERDVHAVAGTRPLAEAGAIAFLTPPGQRTLDVHWDAADVIVLHISGRKRWDLWPYTASAPVRPRGRLGLDPAASTESHLLSPGDLLYIPSGMPHAATALPDEHSLHLTINLPAVTPAVVLERGIDASEALGRPLTRETDGEPTLRMSTVDTDAIAESVRRDAIAIAPSCRIGLLERLIRPPAAGDGLRLLPTDDYELLHDGDRVTVLCRGARRAFAGATAVALTHLWADGRTTVGTGLPVEAARTLVAMGIAERF